MCFRVFFFSTKLDPHRRPWRNVSIRDIVISSTVRSIDHCSASALLGPPSRARRLWFFFFFFNRWQNSQRDGFAFCSFLYLSLPSYSFVLSSLFFSLSFWEKKREAWYTCQAGFAASLLSSLWFEGFDYETVSHYQELASFSNHASQHYVWKWHSNGDIKKPSNKNGVAFLLL